MEAAREAGQETDVDIDTGAGVPAWQLRLEGRLLDVSYTSQALLHGREANTHTHPLCRPTTPV